MVQLKLCKIITILCIISKTNAFLCWCCASDEPDSEYCGSVLDESNLTRNQKLVNLVQCSYPHFDLSRGRDDLITKCMIQKTINKFNGKIVYSRSCVWEERNAQEDACLSHYPPYGHQILTCETCMQDNCNYRLFSDINDNSAYIVPMYKIVFICLVLTFVM